MLPRARLLLVLTACAATSVACDDASVDSPPGDDSTTGPSSDSEGTITGTVVALRGSAPVPGVTVTAARPTDRAPSGPVATTVSGADGRYALENLAAGAYTVTADGGRCRNASRTNVDVVAGGTSSGNDLAINASADGLAAVAVKLVDNLDGHALAGATVQAETAPPTTADATGAAILDCVAPGAHVLHASFAGYMDGWDPVLVGASTTGAVTLPMAVEDPPASTQGLPPRAVPNTLCMNVHTHYVLQSEIDAVSSGGWKFHRLGMDQYLIENAPWTGYQNGVYNFGYTDPNGGGDGPIGTVPDWLQHGVRMLGSIGYNAVKFNGPPRTQAQIDDWVNFVRQAAQAFKGKQVIYETGNEPMYYEPGWTWPDDIPFYVDATRQARDAIHAVDPDARLCGPAGGFDDDNGIKMGLGDAVDCYDDHFYAGEPEDNMAAYKHLRATLAQYSKQPPPIINSEQGYTWTGNAGEGGPMLPDQDQVAIFMVRMYMVDLLNDSRLSCWYDWNHLAGYSPAQPTPRAIQAFGALVEALDGYRFLERVNLNDGKRDFLLVFQKDRARRYVAWTRDASHSITFYVGAAKVDTVSWAGDPLLPYDTQGGALTLGISSEPQYVEPLP